MGICKFCKRNIANKGALVIHERSCKCNPERVPGTFFGKTHTIETRKKQAKSFKGKIPDNLYDISKRTKAKILKRLGAGCSHCKWNEGMCDVHHITPKKHGGGNEHTNLTLLCPNCHRLAHEGKLITFINLNDYIGEKWRECYYSHPDKNDEN